MKEYKTRIENESANAARWGFERPTTSRQNLVVDRYHESVCVETQFVKKCDATTSYDIYEMGRTFYVMNPKNSCYGSGEYIWASTSLASCRNFLQTLGKIVQEA